MVEVAQAVDQNSRLTELRYGLYLVYTLYIPEASVAKEAMFTLKLESDLRESFMAEAEAAHRPASQLVREFMRNFVQQQRQTREHDAWLRGEIQQGVREADDPAVKRISHEEVTENWRRQRADLLKRAGRKDG